MLPNEQHDLGGVFHILDSKTIYIDDFEYDGGGPGDTDRIIDYILDMYCKIDSCTDIRLICSFTIGISLKNTSEEFTKYCNIEYSRVSVRFPQTKNPV